VVFVVGLCEGGWGEGCYVAGVSALLWRWGVGCGVFVWWLLWCVWVVCWVVWFRVGFCGWCCGAGWVCCW
ncbi:hypothetical protein, partial [Pseudomonas syringae group genomosp. 7]|uniref:hypothetical protein n=1 Tax=Pseudomonas syringae group genomosp. 7 TaxID=251699 RepID=UPI00376F53A8